MTTTHLFANRATAKLAVDVASNDSALTLVAGGGALFPAPGANQYFRLVLQKGTASTDQREYMVCTAVNGDVLTVTRGLEGTPAAAFTVGDEVSMVATALTFGGLVQKVGVTLQGALEVEADPTTPLGIATKQMVTAGAFPEAPNDAKTYGRHALAWLALGDAAALPVPVPVSAGGTGGITVKAAQTNLGISSTTFDDNAPATPNFGDRWIRPANMVEYVWAPNAGGASGIWINPQDAQSEAYPIPVSKGGTGATTIKQALINLGIADHDSIKVTKTATDTSVEWRAAGAPGSAQLALYKSTTGLAAIYGMGGSLAAPQPRWGLLLGDGTAESGSNAGSNFSIGRYADDGTYLGTALTINRATGALGFTGGLGFPDGTLAAPGITWTTQPTSGWYHPNNSYRQYVVGGTAVETLNLTATNTTTLVVSPQVAGAGNLTLVSAPWGAANYNSVTLSANAAGHSLGEGLAGSNTAKPLAINFPAGVAINSNLTSGNINVNVTGGANATLVLNKAGTANASDIYGMLNGSTRWLMRLGAGAPDDFQIVRYNDSGAYVESCFMITRASGLVSFPSAGGVQISGSNGLNVAGGPISTASNLTASGALTVSGTGYVAGVFTAGSTIVANSNTAMQANGYADWGSPNLGINVLSANPGWNPLLLQALHVQGQWAGWRMAAGVGGSGTIDFALSGSTSNINMNGGTVTASTFNGALNGNASSASYAANSGKWAGAQLIWSAQGVLSYMLMANDAGSIYPVAKQEFVRRVTSNDFYLGWTGSSLIAQVDGTQMTIQTSGSRRELKESIAPSKQDSVALIEQIPFREFRFKKEGIMDDPRLHPCGLILDEVEGFAPDWVDEFEDNKHPNQFFMLMSAMHAIQQLTKRINELEKA